MAINEPGSAARKAPAPASTSVHFDKISSGHAASISGEQTKDFSWSTDVSDINNGVPSTYADDCLELEAEERALLATTTMDELSNAGGPLTPQAEGSTTSLVDFSTVMKRDGLTAK